MCCRLALLSGVAEEAKTLLEHDVELDASANLPEIFERSGKWRSVHRV